MTHQNQLFCALSALSYAMGFIEGTGNSVPGFVKREHDFLLELLTPLEDES